MPIRQAVLFVVVALVGCGNPSVPSTTQKPETEPPAPKPPAEPTYTIKVREKQAGEKYEVTQVVSVDLVKGGDKGQPKFVKTNTAKTTYTEDVQAVADGKVSKTKRAYGVADSLYDGNPLTLSFSNKAVTIERTGEKQFKFALADGGSVGIDGAFLQSEFERPSDRTVQPLLPTVPVKVGEEWEIPKDNLVAYFGPFAAPWKGTGKLTRVYPRDGKQYGTFSIVAGFPSFMGEPPREIQEWSYDGCIDGSTTDSTRKDTNGVRILEINGKKDTTTELRNVLETTTKPAK